MKAATASPSWFESIIPKAALKTRSSLCDGCDAAAFVMNGLTHERGGYVNYRVFNYLRMGIWRKQKVIWKRNLYSVGIVSPFLWKSFSRRRRCSAINSSAAQL